MGYSWMFNIPGHTGTDQKPKKAFERSKAYRKIKKVDPNKHQSTQGYEELLKERTDQKLATQKRFLLFSIIIAFSCVGLFFLSGFQKSAFETKSPVLSQSKSFNQNAYQVIIESGNRFLHDGMLDEAQKDFIQAQKLNPYGVEANLGLTKTLVAFCEQEGRFCSETESYISFVEKLEGVNQKELDQLIITTTSWQE